MSKLKYLSKNLKYDLSAGVISFLVALPLCLGIAHASGAPLYSGVIAGVVGGLVVPLISGAQLAISGPAAGLSVIVFAGIFRLGTFEAFLSAIFLCGIFQLLFGLLKGGIIGYYIPSSVVKGMLTAIGILLVLNQLPHVLGYDKEIFNRLSLNLTGEHSTIHQFIGALTELLPGAAIISLTSLLIMFLWEYKAKKYINWYVGPLLAVIVACLINNLFWKFAPEYYLFGEHLVHIPKIRTIDHFNLPELAIFTNPQVWYTAATLALIASIETLVTVEAIDQIDPEKRQTPLNKELLAQGTGNIVSSLLGGLPISAVIVRSTTNINAGAKTKVSAVFHSILLFTAVAFIPFILNKVPVAALSTILLVVGFRLLNIRRVQRIFKEGMTTFLPFAITVLAILFTDLLTGIIIGTIAGLLAVLRTNFHSAIGVISTDNEVVIQLKKDVSFLNKAQLIQTLNSIPEGKRVLIDGEKAEFIDKDIAEVIQNFKAHSEIAEDRKVVVKNTKYKTNWDENAFYRLFEGNKEFIKEKTELDPDYFKKMAQGQSPDFLWIGCSDSRVPSDEITQTDPGEMFVHRNIANLVIKTDFNLMSVLQYAVQVLKVKHVIVCGHYECGGVKAAMGNTKFGLIDNWLSNIKDTYGKHVSELEKIENFDQRFQRMVELSVIEQVHNLAETSVIQDAWKESQYPIIHGWVYDIKNGAIKDLNEQVKETSVLPEIYRFQV